MCLIAVHLLEKKQNKNKRTMKSKDCSVLAPLTIPLLLIELWDWTQNRCHTHISGNKWTEFYSRAQYWVASPSAENAKCKNIGSKWKMHLRNRLSTMERGRIGDLWMMEFWNLPSWLAKATPRSVTRIPAIGIILSVVDGRKNATLFYVWIIILSLVFDLLLNACICLPLQ